MTGEKECMRCGKIKPYSEFHINRRVPDGRANWCKACEKENRLSKGSREKVIPDDFKQLMEEAIKEFNFSTIKIFALWQIKEKEFTDLGYKVTDITKGIGKLYLKRNGYKYVGNYRWMKE